MNSNNCNCGGYDTISVQNTKSTLTSSTGDSRKIRIGNDIKLDVTIQELNGMDIINVKALKCIIINTTPMLTDHVGNAYEIHRCGLPTYNCLPSHRNGICTWKDGRYEGFGMYPCMHKNWNLCPHYDYFYRNPYGRSCLKCINPETKPFEFIAPVKALPQRNKVRVFFPASAQMLCGLYSLTFIVELYEPGYHSNDLRTITVDYNNIFELVPNMEGASGDIIIDIDKSIGLNSYDNYMFGNINCNCNCCNCNLSLQLTNVINVPDSDIRVGQVKEITVGGSNGVPTNVEWSLTGAEHASIVKAYNNVAQVFGNKISNTVDGYNDVILMAESNGSVASGNLRVHNYAVDINIGGYTSSNNNTIRLTPGLAIVSTIYVTLEDGTRISVCERGGKCQAIEVGSAQITEMEQPCVRIANGIDTKEGAECSWTYDEVHGNTATYVNNDSTTSVVSDTECCPENQITIQNINTSSSERTAIIRLESNMKGQNGLPIQKNITVICMGNGSSNGEPVYDDESDIYIESGDYNPDTNSITFDYHGNRLSFDVELTGIGEVDNTDYWYTEN